MVADPKEHASGNQAEDLGKDKATVDPDNNLGRGAPSDRDERADQQRKEKPEHRGRSEGEAHKQWERKAEDLDREDAAIEREIEREGVAGEKPGARPKGDADFVRDKG